MNKRDQQQHRRWEIRATYERELTRDFGPKRRDPGPQYHNGRISSNRSRLVLGDIVVFMEGDEHKSIYRDDWLRHSAVRITAPNRDLLLTFQSSMETSMTVGSAIQVGLIWTALTQSGQNLVHWNYEEYAESFSRKNYRQSLKSLLLMVRCIGCGAWTEDQWCVRCAKTGLLALARTMEESCTTT